MSKTKEKPKKIVELTIDGEVFPSRVTMGAMKRFKEETGHEVSELDFQRPTDLCTFLWCCVASASKHDGKEFNLSLMDFADSLEPADVLEWAAELQKELAAEDEPPAGEEKKSSV